MTGKAKWEALTDIPRFSGVLSTAGGVVFSGKLTGELEAFDADNGNKLWQFKTGSGIEGQPVTWQQDGVQYIAVSSGIGGGYDAVLRRRAAERRSGRRLAVGVRAGAAVIMRPGGAPIGGASPAIGHFNPIDRQLSNRIGQSGLFLAGLFKLSTRTHARPSHGVARCGRRSNKNWKERNHREHVIG